MQPNASDERDPAGLAPIGAVGAIAFTIGQFGAGSLLSLGALIAEGRSAATAWCSAR